MREDNGVVERLGEGRQGARRVGMGRQQLAILAGTRCEFHPLRIERTGARLYLPQLQAVRTRSDAV